MIRKIKGSLTVKIFLLIAALLMAVGTITYGMVVRFLPAYYSSRLEEDLDAVSEEMADTISSHEKIEDAFKAVELFEAGSQVSVVILDEQGNQVWPVADAVAATENIEENDAQDTEEDTASGAAADSIASVVEEFDTAYEDGDISDIGESTGISFAVSNLKYTPQTTVKHYDLKTAEGTYTMMVFGGMQPVNQAIEILYQILPYILGVCAGVAVAFALAAALYLTMPVVRLCRISENMARLNFNDRYQGRRTDEIGILGKNLNELSSSLSRTLGELRRANEKLKSDIEQEREMERKRIEFFSAVSHELKTPVTILKGHLDGMLQGVGEYQNRDYYLKRSRETTEKMEGMVQELLTVSRIDTPGFTAKRTDVAELLRQQLADMTELIEEKRLGLSVNLPEHLYAVVNEGMMEKVFRNLLMNAIRYTPGNTGNEIRIMLREAPEGNASFACSIENTGVFLPGEALPHVFEAFYRVEQSRNSQTGGSGLGLYIVKMVLDQHKAIYTMENTVDGVKFSFRL